MTNSETFRNTQTLFPGKINASLKGQEKLILQDCTQRFYLDEELNQAKEKMNGRQIDINARILSIIGVLYPGNWKLS